MRGPRFQGRDTGAARCGNRGDSPLDFRTFGNMRGVFCGEEETGWDNQENSGSTEARESRETR